MLCGLLVLVLSAAPAAESPAKRVGLHEILSHAEAHAPALRVARARLGYAEVSAGAATLLPDNPQVTGSYGRRSVGGSTGSDLVIGIEQRIEIAGEPFLRSELADNTRRTLELEVEAARWVVHRDVHAAFHAALVARERSEAAMRLAEFAAQLVEIARTRLNVGDVSPLAVRIAETEGAQARQALLAAQLAYRAACLELARVSGWPTTLAEPAGQFEEPRPLPADEHLLRLAMEHDPDLRVRKAAQLQLETARALAGREAWPEPALGFSYEREGDGLPGGAERLWLATVSLPLPLWKRSQAERAQAEADLAVARVELEVREAGLRVGVLRAADAVRVGAERVAAYGTEILPSFEKNLELLRRAYELGEVDILQVSVGRERFLEVQEQALNAFEDYYRAIAELESELGVEIWADEHHEGGSR